MKDHAPVPILVLNGYRERYELGHSELADFSSRLVSQAAVEMMRSGLVQEVLITTNCLEKKSKLSVAEKMKNHIEEQLAREGITTSVRVHALPKANSTRGEVRTARRYRHKLRRRLQKMHFSEELSPLLFMGIGSHRERITRTVERTFGRRALQNGSVQVEDAESVLYSAQTSENDYATLLDLEKKDIGRRAFNNREARYNETNKLFIIGRLAPLGLQPFQKWVAPWIYRKEFKTIENEERSKREHQGYLLEDTIAA